MHLLLKSVFVFYGYIATEEGSMIIQQQYAYKGLLPFVDYDAWNSLLNDYLVGWYRLFITPTIFHQRLVGLVFSVIIAYWTFKLAATFKRNLIIFFTALFISFGSYTYTYLSTVPYSESTMMLFLLPGIFLYVKNNHTSANIKTSVLTGVLFLLATIIRIQALPAFILFIYAELQKLKKWKKNQAILLLSLVLFFTILLWPFLIKGPQHLWYSLTWPFRAERLLIYQMNLTTTFSSYLVFLQEALRDYLLLLIIFFAGTIAFYKNYFRQTQHSRGVPFIVIVVVSFIASGLVHKPPFASYIYPAVPLLAVVSAVYIDHLFSQIQLRSERVFIILLISFFFTSQLILFPHDKYIKTSLTTIASTPHEYLEEIGSFVRAHSSPQDTILSFYSPVAVTSERIVPANFNRDRFSMSVLDSPFADLHHLMSTKALRSYIASGIPKLILFSDSQLRFAGKSPHEIEELRKIINQRYQLIHTFNTLPLIEYPKATSFYVFNRIE